jgi:hypothetical protein
MNTLKSTLLPLLAIAVTVLFVWYGKQPGAPAKATWDDVLVEAKDGGYRIITTEELADRYTTDPSGQLLVDTRQEWEYRTGHIEGAVNFPMEPSWWARWRDASKLEDFLGPDKKRDLVFY